MLCPVVHDEEMLHSFIHGEIKMQPVLEATTHMPGYRTVFLYKISGGAMREWSTDLLNRVQAKERFMVAMQPVSVDIQQIVVRHIRKK